MIDTEQKSAPDGALATMQAITEKYLAPSVQVIPGIAGSDDVAFIVHGKDLAVKEFTREMAEQHSDRPFNRRGVAVLQTVDSLIEHTVRFADEHTVIFANADRQKPSITAVLDYHEATADGAPRWGNHRGTFTFPLSDEWKAWTGQSGRQMTMIDFSRFLEDNVTAVQSVPDISVLDEHQRQFIASTGGSLASPSLLFTLAANLKVNEGVSVKEARNLSSGEAQVEFVSTHETEVKADVIKVPSAFIIAVPVFKNSTDAFQIIARLRYRTADRKLIFWFDLWRVDPTFDLAFTEACDKVKESTKLPLLYGTPENC